MAREEDSLSAGQPPTPLLHTWTARVVVCTSPWLTLTTAGLHFRLAASSVELLELALQ